MGYLSTMAMIESGADRPILLRWHLQTNHYQPVSTDWIPCCEWVIDRAIAGEDLDVIAPVPEGYKLLVARRVLEELHLRPWVQVELK
jgi:hypothetical protein